MGRQNDECDDEAITQPSLLISRSRLAPFGDGGTFRRRRWRPPTTSRVYVRDAHERLGRGKRDNMAGRPAGRPGDTRESADQPSGPRRPRTVDRLALTAVLGRVSRRRRDGVVVQPRRRGDETGGHDKRTIDRRPPRQTGLANGRLVHRSMPRRTPAMQLPRLGSSTTHVASPPRRQCASRISVALALSDRHVSEG